MPKPTIIEKDRLIVAKMRIEKCEISITEAAREFGVTLDVLHRCFKRADIEVTLPHRKGRVAQPAETVADGYGPWDFNLSKRMLSQPLRAAA